MMTEHDLDALLIHCKAVICSGSGFSNDAKQLAVDMIELISRTAAAEEVNDLYEAAHDEEREKR